ncbi:MAG TPA: Calx-beta domain-containing protein [Woeseiaceae bacterium]|nr:Calx-beta domain-containing protein [Woeseiaceae bacterium]
MRPSVPKASALLFSILSSIFVSAAAAQGLMPIPDVSAAKVESEALLVSGFPWGGEYEYRYTITSPSTNDGKIWLVNIDVSAEERAGDRRSPPRTYPVQGGTQFASMVDDVRLLAPFDGEKGADVLVVDQRAPSGWNGGVNVRGFVQFASADTTFAITPGSSMGGFTISFDRPPTIRSYTIVPHWIMEVEDHSTVTDQELFDAFIVEQSLSVDGFTLGPLDIQIGGWQHYSVLFDNIARSASIGWVSNSTLVSDIEAAIGEAQQQAGVGNNGLALAALQAVFDSFDAADPSTFKTEFRQLVELNVAALIDILPSAFNSFIPVFTATPKEAEQPIGETFSLSMEHFNSALEGNPPLQGLRLLVRCVTDYPCANAADLTSGTALTIGATGQAIVDYVGQNVGIDLVEVVENDNEAFRQLALVKVTWTADTDLVVPAFVPPVILAGAGNTVFMSDRTSNIGIGDVNVPTTTRYYISDDDPINVGNAVVLGERVVPPLGASEADDSMEVEFVIPSGFDEDVHFMAACADDDNVVHEADEDNNCSFSEIVKDFDAFAVEPDTVVVLPTISLSGAAGIEGDVGQTDFLFSVSINAPDPSNDITVDFVTQDSTATSGEDFQATNIQVVFPAGTTELVQSIPVTVFGDFKVEDDESFNVELTNASTNVEVVSANAAGAIENDDLVAVTVSDVSSLEGDSGNIPFVFEVAIDQPHPSEVVTVNLQTAEGSALDGIDYIGIAPVLSFAAGSTDLSQNVSVNILGDLDVESDETFSLLISSVSENAAVLEGVGLGTILNDDLPPELDCSPATATPNALWPPNHKLVSIEIGGVLSENGAPAVITVTAIEQDEPVNGTGDGDTIPDGFGVGTDTPQIRRERSGQGDGRIYVISFVASDLSNGASCSGILEVGVPHDQGQGSTPIDSGFRFDSTAP